MGDTRQMSGVGLMGQARMTRADHTPRWAARAVERWAAPASSSRQQTVTLDAQSHQSSPMCGARWRSPAPPRERSCLRRAAEEPTTCCFPASYHPVRAVRRGLVAVGWQGAICLQAPAGRGPSQRTTPQFDGCVTSTCGVVGIEQQKRYRFYTKAGTILVAINRNPYEWRSTLWYAKRNPSAPRKSLKKQTHTN